MAFQIKLYTFQKKQNSTAIPAANVGLPVMGEFKESTSLINPDVYITPIAGATVYAFNYAYIPELQRYYWITGIIWDNGRYLLNLAADVLGSYKAAIGASSQYVARSSNAANGYLIDSMYPRTTRISTTQKTLAASVDQSLERGWFILGLISPSGSILGCVTYYVMNYQAFVKLRELLLTDLQWTGITEVSDELVQTLFNPFQYIVSCKWFPIAPPANQITVVSEIKFGYWTFSIQGVQGATAALFVPAGLPVKTGKKYDVPFTTELNHPQISRGRYLNSGEFTDYYLMLTGYGKMKLPNDAFIAGLGISIYEAIDFVSGESILNVFIGSGNAETMSPLLTAYGHKGVDLPFGSSDVDVLKAAAGATGAVTGAVTSFMMGNIASGITAVAQGISDTAHELSPTVQMGGGSGSFAAFGEFGGIDQIQCVFHIVANDDNADLGKPLCEVRTISAIPGYIQCVNAHCPISGTLSEQTEVERFLNTGFYYE